MPCVRSFTVILSSFLSISCVFAQTGAWTVDTFAGMDRPVKDGVPGTSSLLNTPGSVAIDSSGDIVFADTGNRRIRKIAPNGTISTIAGIGTTGNSGDGGSAISAQFISPQGITFDSKGNLYIADFGAEVVRMIDTSGIVTTVAGNGVPGNTGDGGKATLAKLNGPYAVAVDKSGALYIADSSNNAVRKVVNGMISAVTTSSVLYPEGLAFDSAGTLYISSWGDNKVYKVSPTGSLTLFAGGGTDGFSGDGGSAAAASLNGPANITFDSTGTLWIADSLNNRIRTVTTDGVIQTVIGSGYSGISGVGKATSVSVYSPIGVAVDSKGVAYWSESGNHRIREYFPNNQLVTELAGYSPTLTTTGGPTAQLLFNPFGVSTDPSGNVYIA
ncbi:MAG: DUF839 domain-containing protein, partial [Acidobacteriota bacterium]|nr:DUF839 domain-containing protein [Acidobacteriota bacterium]